jgi:hypothetical protein
MRPAIDAAIDRGKRVGLLVSIKDYFTDPDALHAALRLSRRKARFQIKLSRNPRFHAKGYLFDFGSRAVALIGSANMTTGGMRIDGDLSMEVEAPSSAGAMVSVRRWFTAQFDDEHAQLLDQPLLDAYRRARPRTSSKQPRLSKAELDLRALLKARTPESETTTPEPIGKPALWQLFIGGHLSPKADAQLEAADWYADKTPAVACFGREPRGFNSLRRGQKVLVFDYSSGKRKGRLRPASIVETHDYPPTEDGRLFVVLKYARRGTKTLTPKFTDRLRTLGFGTGKNAFSWSLRRIRPALQSALRSELTRAVTG